MFVVGNLLEAVALVVEYVLQIYSWIVIARVVISWVNADPYNPIVRAIYSVTEPVLYRIRRALPVYGGGIDFSPIVRLHRDHVPAEFPGADAAADRFPDAVTPGSSCRSRSSCRARVRTS